VNFSTNALRIAIKSLMGHPMRMALAVLAIMIGVASLIVLVGIGRGAEQKVRSTIDSMGTNLIVVSAGRQRVIKGEIGQVSTKKTLIPRDASAVEQQCPSVLAVAPAHAKKLAVRYETKTYSTKIVGTLPAIRQIRNVELQTGSFFDEVENRLMAHVAVVGPTVVDQLFEGQDPMGKTITIGKVGVKVIGVTAPRGSVSGEDQDDQIFVPLRTAMRKLVNLTYLSHIYVEAAASDRMNAATDEIRSLLRERHRLREGKEDDFTIQNQADVLETQSSVARTFSLLIVSIAFASLIIGGVGILGVMLLSIRERVSEIGIRRAVGARRRDILAQFLFESAFLGVMGGSSGLVVGIAGSIAVKHLSGMPVVLAPDYIVLSLVFSIVTGLIFGIYPSWKAARLDPIEALTTDA
jgi:putative ABC transport system permease protein